MPLVPPRSDGKCGSFLKMGDFFKRNSRRSNPSLMGFDEWLGRVLTHCTTWLAQKSITMGFLGDIWSHLCACFVVNGLQQQSTSDINSYTHTRIAIRHRYSRWRCCCKWIHSLKALQAKFVLKICQIHASIESVWVNLPAATCIIASSIKDSM